jgi:ketosteroid isomerase-like protein
MKMLSGVLALVLLLGTVPVVWAQADPAKEVADIRAKQGAAGAKGEVDGVLAPMADNVVFTAARPGFRIEGKEAVRAFLTNLFQNYPTRQELARQVTYRVYQEGNVVVVNNYVDQVSTAPQHRGRIVSLCD